jgi:uncharacterized DUF497 family protein
VATIVRGDFEWDDAKAASNVTKHGVTFEEAITAFEDPKHVIVTDDATPERFALIGLSNKTRLLFVIHVVRNERERVISARLATAEEETLYIQG